MDNFETVAEEFVKFYYHTFDTNRAGLEVLYRPQSVLTFEGEARKDVPTIKEKLVGLPFQKVKHEITTLDAQPINPGDGLVVMVTGKLLVDDQQQPMNYCQTFNLVKDGGSYFVLNDVFRLVYG